jgi:hypothetical protein
MKSITPETFDAICERLANGESLRSICRDDDMPSLGAFFRYVGADQSSAEQYARAREANGDFHGSSVAQIAADVVEGRIPPDVARVAMDAHKWTAGKLKPKVYGDKVIHGGEGPSGEIIFKTVYES